MVSRRSRIAGAVVLLGSTVLVAALVLSNHRYGSILRSAGAPQATDPERPTTDLFGDPLPDGAMARIGTVRFRSPSEITKASMSPDGKLLAVLAGHGKVMLWDAATGLLIRTIETPQFEDRSWHPDIPRKLHETIEAMAFAADSRHLNVMTTRGALRTCDATDGTWTEPLAMTTRVQADRYGPLDAHSDVSEDGTHFTYTRYRDPSSRVEVFVVGKDKPILEIEDPEFGSWGRRARFSSDNKRIAIALDDGTLKVWDLGKGHAFKTYYGPDQWLSTYAFSPDWSTLAATFIPHSRSRSFSLPVTLVTWDASTGKERYRVEKWDGMVLNYSADGKRLIGLTNPPEMQPFVADEATGKVSGRLGGHSGEGVSNYALSRDGRRLVTLGRDRSIIVWDLDTEKPLVNFDGPRGGIRTLAFSADGETIFAAGSYEHGSLWDARTGRRIHWLEVEGKRPAASAAFTPDGKHVVVGYGWTGTSTTGNWSARMWSVADAMPVREFAGHKDMVHHLAVSPDGKQLATMDRGVGLVRLWEIDTGRQIREAGFSKDHTARIAFPKAGDVIGIAPAALSPGASRREAEFHRAHVLGGPPGGNWPIPNRSTIQALSHCGGFVAIREDFGIGNRREQIVIRVAGTGEVIKGLLVDRDAALSAVAFSPNNQYVAVGSHKRDYSEPTVHVFEMQTGREVRTLRGHRGGISALAFTPDGTKLATGSADSTVLIWDLTTPP